MPWEFLFSCPVCARAPHASSFPLCRDCDQALIPAPPLCPECAGVLCPQFPDQGCFKPWISEESSIRSYHSFYLALGTSYAVLRKWKHQAGPSFNRRILKPPARAQLEAWRNTDCSAIVPVPQRLERSWRLRGSPALRVAEWLSTHLKLPLLRDALLYPEQSPVRRQAERGLRERLENRMRFELEPGSRAQLLGKGIWLVDDFLTSGKTLQSAAKALLQAGAAEVHAFSLGIRPAQSGYAPGLASELGSGIPAAGSEVSPELSSSNPF